MAETDQARTDVLTITDDQGRALAYALRLNDDSWRIGTGRWTSQHFDTLAEIPHSVIVNEPNLHDVEQAVRHVADLLRGYHYALDEADRLLTESLGQLPDWLESQDGEGEEPEGPEWSEYLASLKREEHSVERYWWQEGNTVEPEAEGGELHMVGPHDDIVDANQQEHEGSGSS